MVKLALQLGAVHPREQLLKTNLTQLDDHLPDVLVAVPHGRLPRKQGKEEEVHG